MILLLLQATVISAGEAPFRIHLKDAAGMAVRAPGLPFFNDHFVSPGPLRLELAPGRYTYEIERGPEFVVASGAFEAGAKVEVALKRLADLASEGWWSGDLHVHRPPEEVELLMKAEDLHVAPVITWWNQRNLWDGREVPADPLRRFEGDRLAHVLGGEDEREGGALLYFNLPKPLEIRAARREHPSPVTFLEQARRVPGAWIDVEKPFWWDAPTWLAGGKVDSIGIANNHMCRSRMYEDEAWGRPRDAARLPAPLGNGAWTQEIYAHVLSAGLRIPPSAGSASGVLPNPVGYNRLYVAAGPALTAEGWWEGLRAGRVFVTNGPLLRVTAGDRLPGAVFKDPVRVKVALKGSLVSRDPIRAIEVVRDGLVVRTVKDAGALGELEFDRSGWFLVRALADNDKTFRFASTGPFYVEIGATPRRISRASAQFFLDWVRERMGRVKLEDPQQRREVLAPHEAAEQFWLRQVKAANAE